MRHPAVFSLIAATLAGGLAARASAGAEAVRVEVGAGGDLVVPVDPITRDGRAREQTARSRAMARALNPDGAVDRVLYPMSGADAFTPFTMFDGRRSTPTQVMMVDERAFGSADELRRVVRDAAAQSSHFFYLRPRGPHQGKSFINQAPLSMPGVGAAIVWELARLGADQVSIEHLDPSGAVVRDAMTPAAAARIRFSLGGRARELLYLQHRIGRGEPPPLLRRFLDQGYDAFLEKAASDTWEGSPLASFAAEAIRSLRPHGLMVTDDLQYIPLARLGLLPMELVGELAPSYGYGAKNPRHMFGNPILRPTARGERERIADGVGYLREVVRRSETDREAVTLLYRMSEAGMLDRVEGRARQLGLRWPRGLPSSRGAVRRLFLARLPHAPGETAYLLKAAIEELGPGEGGAPATRLFRAALQRSEAAPMDSTQEHVVAEALDDLADRGRVTPGQVTRWRAAVAGAEATRVLDAPAAAQLHGLLGTLAEHPRVKRFRRPRPRARAAHR